MSRALIAGGARVHAVYRADAAAAAALVTSLGEALVPLEADLAIEEDPADADIVAQIHELLETRIRPAVANDGGDIVYRGYRDGVVHLQMQGACSGCPSSTATLKHGIEGLLKHYIPEVTEVRAA